MSPHVARRALPRIVLAGAIALTALSPLAARADFAEVRRRGVLRVLVVSDEHPAMFSFATGPDNPPGFDREMVEGFARLHRIRLEPVAVTHFENMIPALVEGKGDLIVGIVDTPARRKLIDFTAEILPTRHLAVNRKPAPPLGTVEVLREARVGVVAGSSWEEAAKSAGVPGSRRRSYADKVAVLEALRADAVSAVVMSLSDFTLTVRGDRALQAGVFVGEAGSAAWGVRKQDVELKEALDTYIASRRKSSWSHLVVKYFGEDALAVLGRARGE